MHILPSQQELCSIDSSGGNLRIEDDYLLHCINLLHFVVELQCR
jgi:hypothetical protein